VKTLFSKLLASLAVMVTIGTVGPAAAEPGYEKAITERMHPQPTDRSVIATALRRDLLRVGVGLFEPWVMCDVNGDLIGYEIDVSRKLAEDIGVRIQFVRTDWYFIIPSLIEEKFDLIISGMAITPKRSLHVNFSVPYSEFGTLVVANAMRTEGLSTLADFDSADVVFGARAGTVPEQSVADNFPKATVRTFDSDTGLLQALVSGEVHVAAADQIKATRWLDAHPEILHRPFSELFNKVPEAIALPKGDVDGLNFLDSWIAHHSTIGWLGERRRYWFETRDWADLVATDLAVISRCNESFTLNSN